MQFYMILASSLPARKANVSQHDSPFFYTFALRAPKPLD